MPSIRSCAYHNFDGQEQFGGIITGNSEKKRSWKFIFGLVIIINGIKCYSIVDDYFVIFFFFISFVMNPAELLSNYLVPAKVGKLCYTGPNSVK